MFGSKFIYSLKGLARPLVPRRITQQQLAANIQAIFRDFDAETLQTMADRVRFYHKPATRFTVRALDACAETPARSGVVTPRFGTLGTHQRKQSIASVYFYDTYEWTRYFPDSLTWYYAFGDVNYYLNAPAVTKTRPILPSEMPAVGLERNAILLQLDKQRHFRFVRDPYRFEEKKDVLLFRGGCYQAHRIAFMEKFFHAPFCDLGHVGHRNTQPAWWKPKMPLTQHFAYKFLLSLEGNDVASNLKWILNSNSLCIMPKPKYESWFMESRLQAGVHYCEIRDDYADVQEKLAHYRQYPDAAREIIHHANAFCRTFQNSKVEDALHLLVLRKYFYLSGQLDVTPTELDFFGL